MNGDIDAYRDPMDMLHEATQYLDRVRQTLVEADRFEDILQVRSAGELYRQYAGQRRYGLDIQNIGAEIKLRAERRAGELLSAMPKNNGQLFRGDTMIPRDDTPTYTELGVNKQQASRWQRASALPEDVFEQYLAETKGRHEPLTSAAVLALANSLRKDARAEPPIDIQPMSADTADLFRLIDAGATFGTIYVDPPYGTRSLHDLSALPIKYLAADQAHLHLWTSNAFLFDAKAILDAWGFTYHSTFVWVNPFPGEGPYWRESHTLLLLGVRGSCPFREDMRSWVEVPAEPGGGKPNVIREMIERVSPSPYLDLFGEQAVPNWTIWNPQVGCIVVDALETLPVQPSVVTHRHPPEPVSKRPAAKAAAQSPPPPERDLAADALTSPVASDFRLPPAMSFTKERIPGGIAYVFRHHELGMLGRIVVQEIIGSQCLVSLEVAGDPEDPTTDRRMTVFEPVAKELVWRLELHSRRIEAVLGTAPPLTPPDAGELVESKLIPCERCDAGVALLIFAPGATDPGRFEDYARRMYKQVVQMNVPTYVIGPALGDGPIMERPADILKI